MPDRHTLLYLGRLDRNFARLRQHPGPVRTFRYHDRADQLQPSAWPAHEADVVVFGYMERPGEGPFVVTVDDAILPTPVRLRPERHTDGKQPAPGARNPRYFVVHRSTCKTITPGSSRSNEPGAFTARDYRKAAAREVNVLVRWAEQNGFDLSSLKLCQVCGAELAG